MNLENVTIPIEPRSVGGCLDLAVQFQRTHARQLLGLTALLGVPGLALTYYLATLTNHGLLWGLTIFFFLAPIVGSWIAVGAGHRVFGEAFTVRSSLRAFWPQAARLTVLLWWYRVASLVASVGIVTGFLVAARGGNLAEAVLLEQLEGDRLRRRLGELNRGIQTSPVLALVTIWAYTLCGIIALFLLSHFVSAYLLEIPLWVHPGDGIAGALDRLWYDPVTVTLIAALFWGLYPVARLAWFFCYLDQRIRNECWDVELDCRREARRMSL